MLYIAPLTWRAESLGLGDASAKKADPEQVVAYKIAREIEASGLIKSFTKATDASAGK